MSLHRGLRLLQLAGEPPLRMRPLSKEEQQAVTLPLSPSVADLCPVLVASYEPEVSFEGGAAVLHGVTRSPFTGLRVVVEHLLEVISRNGLSVVVDKGELSPVRSGPAVLTPEVRTTTQVMSVYLSSVL